MLLDRAACYPLCMPVSPPRLRLAIAAALLLLTAAPARAGAPIGAVDPGFGSDGRVLWSGSAAPPHDLAVQADGSLLVLLDARRDIQPDERELLEWLDSLGVAHQLVITKVDKLSSGERGALKDRVKASFAGKAPPVAMVSGETGEGVDQLWRVIARHCQG